MADSFALEGKNALVTGAGVRLGRAMAEALLARGCHLAAHYRTSSEAAEELVRDAPKGCNAVAIAADLSEPGSGESLFQQAVDALGPVDILINSASIFPESTLASFTPEELDANLRIHALAPLALMRAMALQGRAGAVINLLDTRIMEYDAAHVAYHLSKRMLFSLTRMAALEFGPLVRVSAIAPGLVLPPPGKGPEHLQKLAPTNPLQTYGGPDDIVRAMLFLLESPFVTGQVIFVDGGYHMKGGAYA